ncbi:MAG: hypothetical protein BMS9Abin05_2532 [Rhodothermia bacterium]|nr:MAG: hypothetical protein BMS9Abin05_2532 [Rhodothermia bacterium]
MGTLSRYLRKTLKRQIEICLNIKIYSNYAHGREDWYDIKKTGCEVMTIFDVGANTGQSVVKFRGAFPEARIFCFEPVESVFDELANNTKGDERVSLHKMAFADSAGQRTIYLAADQTTNSFRSSTNTVASASVPVSTVDDFTRQNAIDRIDLLKIDAEGYDLKVLEGAKTCLRENKIAFVIVEVGFNENDSLHVPFESVRNFLAPYGYLVFGFYDQQLEWSGLSQLRYANACFCSEKMIAGK